MGLVPKGWRMSDQATESEQVPGSGISRAELASLWSDIVTARTRLSGQRTAPRHDAETASRLALVRALEVYLGRVAGLGYPAPYSLVNELQMQRRICRLGIPGR